MKAILLILGSGILTIGIFLLIFANGLSLSVREVKHTNMPIKMNIQKNALRIYPSSHLSKSIGIVSLFKKNMHRARIYAPLRTIFLSICDDMIFSSLDFGICFMSALSLGS